MNNQIYVNWDGNKVSLKWLPHKKINDNNLFTSVHGYCFMDGKILLVHVKDRGFNTPGGHIELHEDPEQALLREIYEEGYITGTVKYLGAIEVNHKENENFIYNGPYPLIGYQLFYRVDIKKIFPFLRENETITRIWVEPEEIQYVLNDHELSIHIINEALKVSNS